MDEFVLFLIELADRIYAFSPGTGLEEKANRLIADQSNSISNFIDIGSGAKDVSEGTELAETRDALLYCKGFFRPAPSLTIKANGEIATCRVANAGEGYGNLHQQDLIYILNHLQESFIFKLHAERRLGTYRRFVDPDIFGHTFTHQCTMRAILTLIARRMAEEGVDPEDQEAIARINREVAGYTGHLR
jgi:hypothetical protein